MMKSYIFYSSSRMKPMLLLHPSSIFFFLFTFIIIPSSLSADNSNYTNCNKDYSCGSIPNFKYPFWGGDRPDYCGQPNLKINCESNTPKFTVNWVTYRILRWESSTQNLTVARDDMWDNLCVSDYNNTSFDNTVFRFDDGLANARVLYNCTTPLPDQIPQMTCGAAGKLVYYTFDDSSYDCTAVTVPVFGSQAQVGNTNPSQIPQEIKEGFGLKLEESSSDECDTCSDSGGQCGYDRKFICFCKDGPHDTSCSNSGKSSSKVGVGIGAAVGVVALVGILGFVCFMVKRRKRIAAEQSRSKDPFMPPSSSGPVTSTTNSSQSVSQSVPSYHSSKTESVPRSFYFGVQVFTYAELEEATNNFHPSRELGEGGFGTVYKGELNDGRLVAVKRHYESNFKRVEQFMNEVEILARLRHKNLVTLFGCTSRHSRELLLVYEYIPNGTIADHLHGKRASSSFLPWPVRLNLAIETAEALAYLHATDVIHRDVKSNNILLDDKFRVKVADFGLSRLFPNDVTHVSTAPQGTPGYVDPEYYQCYQLTDKSDVYSFGVVLVELISSLQAVDVSRHRNDVNLANMAINKIQGQEVHDLVDPCLGFDKDHGIRRMTTAVAELAFRCLQQQRDMRPSMDEVLEILRGIKSDEMSVKEAEVVNVKTDEAILLKKNPCPVSPDSVADKWVSGSTTSNSS